MLTRDLARAIPTQRSSPKPSMGRFTTMLLLVATGCAQCAPDRVGPGVARLTIRNVGAMVSLVSADKTCGFASPSVLAAPTVEGAVGGEGSLTFTVTDCAIDAGGGLEVSKNCEGATTTAKGKVTVTAKRQVKGKLTGNPASPIIPSGPDAVTITVEKATFEEFLVESSSSPSKLRMISGSLAATVSPRLAVSKSTGACALGTPNVTFTDVRYAASKLFVDSADNKFDVDVTGSSFSAQNGVNGDRTNDLSGGITVFGRSVSAGDQQGLDPEFNLEKFEAGYACMPDLLTPISYTCADLGPKLAGGAARLTVRTLGTITSLVDADRSCGFTSPAVGGRPALTGSPGAEGSTATFTISTPCAITLPADTLLSKDCAGVETRGSGMVSVTGTKVVKGFRTGNPYKPIVPTSWDPAEFNLTVSFTNYEVKSSASASSLLVKSGSLSGKVAPRTGIDRTTGACSISTPVVTFSDLSWSNASVRLTSDGNKFDLSIDGSSLSAQNGTKGSVSNTITGSITVDGTSRTLGVSEPLDTGFSQTLFDASYACTPNLAVAPNEAACSFRRPLGIAAARLLVKSLTVSTKVINGNTMCGFGSAAVLQNPTNVSGTPGSMGSMTWTVTDCALGPLPANTVLGADCLGTETRASGKITATGTKTVTGMRAANPPIIPVSREASTLAMTSVALDAFELFDLPVSADGGVAIPAVTSIVSGSGSVTVKSIAGESMANPMVYSVATPVASIESLVMPEATIRIWSEGSQFDLALTNVMLNAFSGSFGTKTNQISGSLTVNGEPVTVDTTLDPAFVQATFNSTYACTPDLRAVIPYP